MKLLFLAPTYDETNGWGRFSVGFLREARNRLGESNVIAPNPDKLRSNERSWKTFILAILDKRSLMNRAHACDVIHAANENLAPLAMLLAVALGKPYVVSVHGTYADLRVYRWHSRWLYHSAFSRATFVLPVSRYTEKIINHQLPRVRTKVIPGGFTPSSNLETSKTEDIFHILSVGALKPRKGFHALIESVVKIDGKVILDIVGAKKLKGYAARLNKMIEEHGLEKKVFLHGRISEEELNTFYAKAHLFVLTPEHDGYAFEGLGLVYLEALAQGVPVIGTSDSGVEDVIQDGVNGFLVKPGDIKALAERIHELRTQPELLARLSSHAKESVEDFRWEVVGKKMYDLYKTCLN